MSYNLLKYNLIKSNKNGYKNHIILYAYEDRFISF